MAVTIDAAKLARKLEGKYQAHKKSGDHWRYYWTIDGREYGGAKLSHGKNHDLYDFVASSIARKLGITRDDLKTMEQCSFSTEALLSALRTTQQEGS